MKTEDWALIMTIVQTVVTILTFGALIWQLIKVNATLRQDAYSRAVEDYTQMMNRLLEKPKLSNFFYEGIKSFEELSDDEKDFYNYIALSATLFERIYLLSNKGSLDPEIWQSWERWLIDGWFRVKLFETFWVGEGQFFTKSFQEFVNRELDKFKSKTNSEQDCSKSLSVPIKPRSRRKTNNSSSQINKKVESNN